MSLPRHAVIAMFVITSAALADKVPPSMDKATPQEAIPHPQLEIPGKGESQPGVHAGAKGAPNVRWTYEKAPPEGFDAMRVTLNPRVDDNPKKNFIYWAFDGVFMDNHSWYVGLQPMGEFGKTALFSVFGQGARPMSPACKGGADNGPGTSCHINYEWQLGHSYELTVALIAADADNATWEGAVFDLDTGARTLIGDIQVPASRGYLKPWNVSFSEFFRKATCDQMPKSEALFQRPVGYRSGREIPGRVKELNLNTGCNTQFFTDGSNYVYIDLGQ